MGGVSKKTKCSLLKYILECSERIANAHVKNLNKSSFEIVKSPSSTYNSKCVGSDFSVLVVLRLEI